MTTAGPHSDSIDADKAWLCLALAVLFYVLASGVNFQALTISNPDEPRFACAVRTMLRDGDYLVPKFNGHPRLEKPIFFYWLLTCAAKLGMALGLGLGAAMRLGPLFMGLLAVLATFLLARRLSASSWTGLLAALILMSCNEFHKVSREIVIDMALSAFLIWTWYCFIEFTLEARRFRGVLLLLGFYASLGLACMTKGPLPIAGFAVIPIFIFLVWTKQLALLKRAGLWWGVPLTVALGFWWFYALGRTGHEEGVGKFFLVENIQRIFGQKDHIHKLPYVWYFEALPEVLAPWIVALPFMAWSAYKGRLVKKKSSHEARISRVYAACALGVAFGVIGLSASKRQLYLLPLMPHFAVWAALWWRSLPRSRANVFIERGFVAAALFFAIADSTLLTHMRETAEDRVAFFADIGEQLAGRRVATFGDSANEAIWYLDRTEPILNLIRPKLEREFFQRPGTVLLLNETSLGKTPVKELTLKALKIEYERKRGEETYFLATPAPGQVPDPRIFIGKSRDAGQDSGDE